MPHSCAFKLLLAVRLCQHMPLYVSACPLSSRPLSPSLSPSLNSPPSHHCFSPSITFLSVWVSMRCDPGELITVGAGVAGTKTLHRQHNSSSRNQTGSTQPSQTGTAQMSSVKSRHAHRSRNAMVALSPVELTAYHYHNNHLQNYVILAHGAIKIVEWMPAFAVPGCYTLVLCFCIALFLKSLPWSYA